MSTKQGQPQMVELREFEEVCRERNQLRQERDDQYALLDQQRADFERVLAERDKARYEVGRLVALNDAFKERLQAASTDLRDADAKLLASGIKYAELLEDYDARGKVIKKLRKRLHKLKKKLKH